MIGRPTLDIYRATLLSGGDSGASNGASGPPSPAAIPFRLSAPLVLIGLILLTWGLLELFERAPILPSPPEKVRKVHNAVAGNVAGSAATLLAIGRA